MKAFAQIAFGLAYAVVAIFQWVAEIDGLHQVLEWPTFFCWLLAALTSWIPVVGTAAGIWGAHAAWEWDWLPSFALFLGVPLFFLLLTAVLMAIESMQRRRRVNRIS